VDARSKDGSTPLHILARSGNAEGVAALLGGGADINARTEAGQTPFGLAVERGHTEVADLLRAHGATK
jgi:ankyrin repeat protein